MPKSNLSLSNLYRAWSATTRTGAVSSSLNAANGMAGTAVSMSSFSIDGVTATLPFTYIVENTSENVTFAFTGAGLAFNNRVRTQGNNYVFMLDFNATQYDFSVGTPGQTTAINALNLANTPAYTGSANGNRLSVYFEDGYNSGSTGNYGFAARAEKDIYRVDSYNSINSDILCVATDTQILLADGTSVEAGDLYVGDSIKTFVPEGMPSWLPENDLGEWYWWYHTSASAGEVVDAQVSNIYFSFIDQYVSINDGAIKTTHAHPFYAWDAITNTYQFTRAEDVAEGDKLIKYNNLTGLIEEIDVINVEFHNRNLEIATITVDVAHTFLANGFVSHNKGAASAPIPWQNLTCYLDVQFAASYAAANQTVLNDLSGNTTGFNVRGGSVNPNLVAPTYNATSPKSLTFASGKWGIKQQANSSGTNNSLFGTTNGAGYTFVAFVKNATSGNIFRRGSDFTINLTGGEVRFTSLNNSALNVATSTAGWNMIAITNVGGVIKMYKNNVEIGSTTQTSSATSALADIYLMENSNGELGAFLFYQRAISATEVGHIWNNLKGRFGL